MTDQRRTRGAVRRALACSIVAALVGGVVALGVHRDPGRVERWLPAVVPIGYRLEGVSVAAGASLRNPLSYRRGVLARGDDRVGIDRVASPAADPAEPGVAQPFPDGRAFLFEADGLRRLWWTTSRASGVVASRTAGTATLAELARWIARHGVAAPPGWRLRRSYDPESAVEVLAYRGPADERLQVVVHRRRDLVRIPDPGFAQRRLDDVVVSAWGDVADGDLQSVVRSVRRASGTAWDEATTDLDARPVRWRSLGRGRTSAGSTWVFAVEERGQQACAALLVTEHAFGEDGRCGVVDWRNDRVVAVPTDVRGDVVVTAARRRLEVLGEARFAGHRVVVAELPDELVGQVVDPLVVVSRR